LNIFLWVLLAQNERFIYALHMRVFFYMFFIKKANG